VQKKTVRTRCPVCGSKETVKVGENTRRLRLPPIGSHPAFALAHLVVRRCKDCGAERQEKLEDALPHKSHTKRFSRLVIELAQWMTLSDIAAHLHVGWNLVQRIVKEELKRKVKRRRYRKIRMISVDEIAVKKRHSYMTVVIDLESGQVVHAAEGRDSAALAPFLSRLRRAGARLRAAAMDMSPAYEKAIADHNAKLPDGCRQCVIVTDHFHVVKKMNEALDSIRKDEAARLDEQGRKTLKGKRFLLFFGADKLAEKPKRLADLKTLLEANDTLMKAWLLKESLGLLWMQPSKAKAEQRIDEWCAAATETRDKHLLDMAAMIQKRRENILNYYDYPITNAALEGLNNKIKVLKRKAYGYRDMEFFKLRILTIHETKFSLAGS